MSSMSRVIRAPEDLGKEVRGRINENLAMSWDEAVWELAEQGHSENGSAGRKRRRRT